MKTPIDAATLATFDQQRAMFRDWILRVGPQGAETLMCLLQQLGADPVPDLERITQDIKAGNPGAIDVFRLVIAAAQFGLAHELISISEDPETPE